MNDVDFKLKGSTVTVVVLDVYHYQPNVFPQQLAEKTQHAPKLFQGSPVLINIEKLIDVDIAIDFKLLIQQCRDLGMQPVAFKGVGKVYEAAVAETGLAALPSSSTRAREIELPAEAIAEPSLQVVTGPEPLLTDRIEPQILVKTVIEEKWLQRKSKIITRPVRSGQQVYAEDADLIVMAQVSEGAEVLADGNIHIYGALRGRALAGVRGDTAARIFCQSMEAELISIAGNFLPSDSIPESAYKKVVQTFLEGDALRVESL